MNQNPLRALEELGQSVWLDYMSRRALLSGEIERYIDEDDLRGVTSNPTIFDEAIAGSHDYDADIQALALGGKNARDILRALTIDDIQRAADLFLPTYERCGRADGLASIEVSPHLAHDTEGTVAEARRLWSDLDRPNGMVKVPGTRAGLEAIRRLTSEGVNVNVTLLFGLPRYREVAHAYLSGLEERAARGQPLDHVSSVASFFLSRIDVLLDPRLQHIVLGERAALAARLTGEVAIASAKVAYQMFKELFGGGRFRRLAERGARPQRLLWASTGTKNPAYSDVKYVEPLIGPQTINTVPLKTLHAYRDHGHPSLRLEEGVGDAREVLRSLDEVGIDLEAATQQLEDEGVEKFNKSYDALLATLRQRRSEILGRAQPEAT